MTLNNYIEIIESDIASIETWERVTGPLDCCDNRELETLQNVLDALRNITND